MRKRKNNLAFFQIRIANRLSKSSSVLAATQPTGCLKVLKLANSQLDCGMSSYPITLKS